MIKSLLLVIPSVAMISLVPSPAQGGTPPPPAPIENTKEVRPPVIEFAVESAYTGEGAAEFRGREYGNSDAFNVNVSIGTMLPLSERWMTIFDLQSQNFELGGLDGLPLPESINTLELGTGLAYRPNESWTYIAKVNAGLYKLEDIGSNDIGISGGLMVMWDYNPSLKFAFGLMASPDSDMPVLPVAGLEWVINEDWELQLTFPKPRVIYSLDEHWKLHAGMDLLLGTNFRASDTLGTEIGLPRYNDALGSYSDIRVGGGIGYQLSESLSVEVEGGYSVSREIDYSKIDEKVELDPAPYVRVGLRFAF